MKSDFIRKIRTYENLCDLRSQLDSVSSTVRGLSGESVNRELTKILGDNFESVVNESKRRGVGVFDGESAKKFVDDLIGELKDVRVLELTLAVIPDDALVDAVAEWVGNNIEGDVIADFKLDSLIAGGAIVTYGGRYMDMSVVEKISDAVAECGNRLNK